MTITVSDLFIDEDLSNFLSTIDFVDIETVSEEYTTTYTLKKSQQLSILSFLNTYYNEDYFIQNLPDYCNAHTINDDFTSLKVFVIADEYLGDAYVGLSFLSLYLACYNYNCYAGIGEEDMHCIIHIIDSETNKEIDSIDSDDAEE